MSDRRNYDRKLDSSSSRHGDLPSSRQTSGHQTSGQYDYLTKMYQPPKGTKFATARTKNELSKYEASKQETNLASKAPFLTPGVKEELQRLERTQSSQSYNSQSSSSSWPRNEHEIIDLDSVESSQGSSEKGSSRRHSERSYSVNSQTSQGSHGSSKSKGKRRSRSRSTERSSGSSRKIESSVGSGDRTSANGRKGSELTRRETGSAYHVDLGHRRADDRHRPRSRSRSKDYKDHDYRKEMNYKSERNHAGHFRRPFNNYRGRGRGHFQRGGRNPNFDNNQNSGRPWNNRNSDNKDGGSKGIQGQEGQSSSKQVPPNQNQNQFPNMHGLQVIEKLNKLNMIPQLLKTAQIYETKIEPIEQAKLKERQKLSLIQPKTADETAIARTLETNMICVKNLKDVTSQKRLTSLVCTMRYYLNQMNVEMRFHNKYFEEYLVDFCASMGWDPITAEAALTLDVKNSDALKDFSYQPDEHFKCNKCSLSYPSCKFSCITCRQLFTCLPEVFAHEFTNHGKLVQPSFTCFVCQKFFGTDPVAFSTHFTLEHVCAAGHSECAIGCKSLIVGSSYLELENHNASQHNCKVCGDLVGNSLRHHLEFFHSSMKASDYLPEVYFEPVVDEELAKLHELLENIADVKRENPQLFEETDDVKPDVPTTELDTTDEHQTSSSSIQSFPEGLTISDPLQNIHRLLTTDDKIPLTSLTGDSGLIYSDDSSANLSNTVIDISSNEDEACLYMDSSRDPRLKSEFYKSATFFLNLNQSLHDSGIVDESNLEERLFHNDKNVTPLRSNGVQYDFEVLKYKTAEVFQDIFQTNENQIKPIPVQKEDNLRNRLYPLPQKISRTSKYQQEESLTVEPEANPIFRRSTSGNESSSSTSSSGFLPLTRSISESISPRRNVADVTTAKATSEWDPRFDRIIHEFGEPQQPRVPTFPTTSSSSNVSLNITSSSSLSKSQLRETIPKFGVDFSRSPEKLTEQIASAQNRHMGKERDRDPRLKRNASQIGEESSPVTTSSTVPNYQTHVENSTECERKRMEQTMALYLAIQKP